MKKMIEMIVVGLAVVGIWSSSASATALGGYLELGSGSGQLDYGFTGSQEFDVDTGFFGGGFTLETDPVTLDKLFSYRLQVGLEGRGLVDNNDVALTLGGIAITNTFAFGKNISERFRIWGGPQVFLGFYDGETDEDVMGDRIDVSVGAFGVGIAVGGNYAIGNGKTIMTVTTGVRRLGFAGSAEHLDQSEDITGNTNEFFLSLGVMYD